MNIMKQGIEDIKMTQMELPEMTNTRPEMKEKYTPFYLMRFL